MFVDHIFLNLSCVIVDDQVEIYYVVLLLLILIMKVWVVVVKNVEFFYGIDCYIGHLMVKFVSLKFDNPLWKIGFFFFYLVG